MQPGQLLTLGTYVHLSILADTHAWQIHTHVTGTDWQVCVCVQFSCMALVVGLLKCLRTHRDVSLTDVLINLMQILGLMTARARPSIFMTYRSIGTAGGASEFVTTAGGPT